MIGPAAAVRHHAPPALPLPAARPLADDANRGYVRQGEGAHRRRTVLQRGRRGDGDLRQVDAAEGLDISAICIDRGMRLQRSTDPLVGSLQLERAGDDAAEVADLVPLGRQRDVMPTLRDVRKYAQMHAVAPAV